MKAKLRSGIFCCSSLFLLFQASYIDAQEIAQQPPAPQQQPAQPPAATPAPPPPATPARPQVQQTPAPASPPGIQERDTGGDVLSFEPFFWLTTQTPPLLRLGHFSNGQTNSGELKFPGRSKFGYGGVVTVPTGKENSLQFSYFRIQGQGTRTDSQALTLFGNNFAAGDFYATTYLLQNLKLSWNYLTFPYPSRGAKFRVKTLWELQYMWVNSTIYAPYDINAIPTVGMKDIIYPTFGLGIEYHPAKALRLEAKFSGFAFFHHSDIWDAEASAVFRAGNFEAFLGGKAYHFKTSPTADQYFSDTMWGPSVGLRWIWR